MNEITIHYSKISDLIPSPPLVDLRIQDCPLCGQKLKSIPASKTKCPSCGEQIFVRVDPLTNERKTLSKSDADELDRWRTIRRALMHEVCVDEEDVQSSSMEMESKLGRPVTREVAVIRALEVACTSFGAIRLWGFYRNGAVEIAEIERRFGQLDSAIWKYFDVLYMDLNGPNNVTQIPGSEIPKWYQSELDWNPDLGSIAPAIFEITVELLRFLNFDLNDSVTNYKGRAENLRSSLNLPMSWDVASSRIFELDARREE